MFTTTFKKAPLADPTKLIKKDNPLQKLSENLHKLRIREIHRMSSYKSAQLHPLIQTAIDGYSFVDINKHLDGDKENCLQELIQKFSNDPALEGTLAHKGLLRLQTEKEDFLKNPKQKPFSLESLLWAKQPAREEKAANRNAGYKKMPR